MISSIVKGINLEDAMREAVFKAAGLDGVLGKVVLEKSVSAMGMDHAFLAVAVGEGHGKALTPFGVGGTPETAKMAALVNALNMYLPERAQ